MIIKKIWKKLSILLIAIIMISSISTAQMISYENSELSGRLSNKLSEPISIKKDIENTGFRFVVWDNWMETTILITAQWDQSTQLDHYLADDFIFEEDTDVLDVHWIGGYWDTNYQQGNYNWKILFYHDRGDGEAPGAQFKGPYTYTQDQCNPELILDNGFTSIFEYYVNLPDYIVFGGGSKYWISIWAEGPYPPQSGWGAHNVPRKHHQGVFKSDKYGYPDWTNLSDEYILGDLCFQLTTIVDFFPPKIKIEKPEKAFYIRDSKKFNRRFGITTVIGDITISANIKDDETGIKKVEFYAGLLGNILIGEFTQAPYNLTWKRDRLRFIHIHILTIKAFDLAGNEAIERMLVRKIL